MAIQYFDRKNLKILKQEIDNALATIAKKHKIALSLGSISFSDEQFHGKLQAIVQFPNTSNLSVKEIMAINNVKKYGSVYNVSESDLNKTFIYASKTYRFVGLTPSRKYPVIGQDVKSGKEYKFTESVLTQIKK